MPISALGFGLGIITFSFLVLQFVPKQKGRIETLCVLSFKDWTGYLLMFELKENLTDSTGMEY